MTADNPQSANPYRTGFVDAVMGRPSASPWQDFRFQALYVRGYLYGKNLLTTNTNQKDEKL